MLCITLMLILFATAGHAGPWPRPKGEGFFCLCLEGNSVDDAYATLYTEYGIGRGHTAGLDLGVTETDVDKALIFLNRPITRGTDENSVMAHQLAVGAVGGRATLRNGLLLGKGIMLGQHAGWIALEAYGVLHDGGDGAIEANLTIGADTGTGDKWLVEIQMKAPSDAAPQVKIAPGYAFGLENGRHLVVGAAAGIDGADDTVLTLGLWQGF